MSTEILSSNPLYLTERCDGCGRLSDTVGVDDALTAERIALARRFTFVVDDGLRKVFAYCESCAEAMPWIAGDYGHGVHAEKVRRGPA